ncbi:phosphatidylglycerol lysyltransferase domain-containing protein [Streptomyces sp. NBC_01020]|uniref:phosphatidylglycerol lysyltransferase domain-containing protein n=1 Tax=unclassified Streptomyces TaxID=2593676 RepID=UPI00224DD0A0|nr:phosphatidylglycerol lysyltransferase domain-containing protein [Streptomyces sp. NBC_01306]MCX4724801.1 phosphatidylglycerol lysyltransferase domain-containing protein [Streptomyces sp. NBC_01306]WSV05719.1 phosphatidylglycerol lysyltransferase domain-containing protein [Streptomyces sp. NBC_01020]WSX43806.1 phosphatidylglycerol lysyltransferase domain-containing protein [Streptomyces sp. NBC_00963]WSX68156.1 phosphatidylglycerol lysyltransferase domain-containing protein [Streptomyces sp. 
MSVPVDGEKSVMVPKSVRRIFRGPRPETVPSLVGTACAVVGLLDIAGGAFPRFRHSRMHTVAEVLPGALGPFTAALALCVGVLLLLLAHGLKRRKRRAWRAAVVLLPIGAVAEFGYRHSIVGVLISLVLLTLVVRHRSEFEALPDPRSRWKALANFVLLGAGSLGLGLVIVSVHPGRVVGSPSIADRLQHVLFGLFGFEGPVEYQGNTSWTVAYSLGSLGLLTAVTTIYLAFRPEHPAARLTDEDEKQLRALLAKHGGRDSLGHFALRRDKGVVFSPSGKAAVCYRVVSGVMLASGDPIGDVEAWPGAIERFMDEAKLHSWTPAVMGCSETGGEVWTRETGLDALELGDEAVVDVVDFSLAGRAMRNVRQMVKRIERGGYETRVRRVRDVGEVELERIRAAAAAWRGTDTERGFSMALGRIGDPGDGDCVIATAHKADGPESPFGDLKAIIHFVPWGKDGMSLELMRRDRAADPGMNELLIVAALEASPGLGVERVSLNFAMFRSALARGEKIGAGPVLRGWRGLLVFLSRWFQIESLYKFNAKFRPRWEPRFVVFRNTGDLPRIGFAAMQAEGFVNLGLPWPFARRGRVADRPCTHLKGANGESGARAA